MPIKLDARYRMALGAIIGVIVFLTVGFGLNGALGAFLAGLVAAIVGSSKIKVYGRCLHFYDHNLGNKYSCLTSLGNCRSEIIHRTSLSNIYRCYR